MAALFRGLLVGLKNIRGLLIALLGNTNILGWTVAAITPFAYIAIWIGVLSFCFNAAYSGLTGYIVNVFGVDSFPSGALYLINQTFPLQLFFNLTVGLIVFRLSAASLIVVAVAASRQLKGR